MRKLLSVLMVICLLSSMILAAGCYVPIPYEKRQVHIPPDDSLQITLDVKQGEVVEGYWKADGAISGYYIGPQGTKLRWSEAAVEHTFLIDGREKPGKYIFEFRDTGGEGGTVTFRFRVREEAGKAG